MIRTLLCLLLAATTAASALLLPATELSRDDSVRVEDLLRRHLAASGGKEAMARVTSRRAAGYVERNRTKIPFVQSQRFPNSLYTETRFPRPGTLKQGFDGTTAWVLHPMQGGRTLAGREASAIAAAAWLHPSEHVSEMFPQRKWGGAREIAGQAMLVIELAAQADEPFEQWFFDATTFLLARIEKTIDGGPQGMLPVKIMFEDYRVVDGLTLAHRVRTQLPAMETVLQFDTMEHNVALPDALFAPNF